MSKKDKKSRRNGGHTHKTWHCEAHDATNQYWNGEKIVYGCTCAAPFAKKKSILEKTDYSRLTIPVRLLIREHSNLKEKIRGLLKYIRKIHRKKKKLSKLLAGAGERITELKEEIRKLKEG